MRQGRSIPAGSELLFVYGTLRRGFPGRMARWLQRKGQWLGSGWCAGRLYDLGAYPVMVPPNRERDRVRGDVYLLQHPKSMFPRLDRYEGCSRAARPPGEYRRLRLGVTLNDGCELQAWAYLYRYGVRGLRPISGGDYLRYRRR